MNDLDILQMLPEESPDATSGTADIWCWWSCCHCSLS